MSVQVSVSSECTYDRVLFIMMSTTTFLSSASRLVALVNGEFDPQIYVLHTGAATCCGPSAHMLYGTVMLTQTESL